MNDHLNQILERIDGKFSKYRGKIYQHGLQESIKQTIKSYLEKHDLVLVKKSDLKNN